MNKQEIYEYLNQQHIWYEVTEHKAVYNMEDLLDVEIPYPQADAFKSTLWFPRTVIR